MRKGRNENFTQKMSKEWETKQVPLFKNYNKAYNKIAGKAQQFNCPRPSACFPKDGAPKRLQQSSRSCDLIWLSHFEDISSATTVTTVTTVTFSLGCKSPSFCMALSVLLKLTTSTWAPVKRSSGTRHHGKNHSYQIQQR